MALIKVGSIDDFTILQRVACKENQNRPQQALDILYQDAISNYTEVIGSAEQRGLALKKIQLLEGFGGTLSNWFHSTNEVYFVAWVWDLSGQPVSQYPGEGASKNDVLIRIKAGIAREFIGAGLNLFTKRLVKGGIGVRIQVWKSDSDTRKFGEAMADTAKTIKESKLNNVLSMISLATGGAAATIELVKEASVELAGAVGNILKANGDDYKDFFEGYYPADQAWTAKDEDYKGESSIITLSKY